MKAGAAPPQSRRDHLAMRNECCPLNEGGGGTPAIASLSRSNSRGVGTAQ